MRVFIEIYPDPFTQGRTEVHRRWSAESNPYEGNALVVTRDVTNVEPLPQEGWTVNEDRTYSAH
jgi:hypothetical protein